MFLDSREFGGYGREDGVQVDMKTLFGGRSQASCLVLMRPGGRRLMMCCFELHHLSHSTPSTTPPPPWRSTLRRLRASDAPGRLGWSQLLSPTKKIVSFQTIASVLLPHMPRVDRRPSKDDGFSCSMLRLQGERGDKFKQEKHSWCS